MTRFRLAVAVMLALVSSTPAFTSSPIPTSAPDSAQAPQPQSGPLKPAALTPDQLDQKIDDLLRAYQAVHSFSGAVMLASQGKPLVSKSYGLANREWHIPVSSSTRFRIGSLTKAFTSMLVMQLRERGKVKLDDSVCLYVTRCPDTWQPVTIHHLLTHTSGIPTYTGLPAWRAKNMVPLTIDQMLDYIRDLPLQWTPGDKFAYNNSGYFLLGVVIEKATGKKYEEALQDQILTPLGMKDTGYDWPRAIIPNRASGYALRAGVVENADALDMQQPYAAGSMYSTVDDLLKWDQALYTDTLLPAAARKIMWTPVLSGYAYGWSIAPSNSKVFGGHPTIMHTGGINGFASIIGRLPDINLTIIVLSNLASTPTPRIVQDIAAIYFGQPYQVPSK